MQGTSENRLWDAGIVEKTLYIAKAEPEISLLKLSDCQTENFRWEHPLVSADVIWQTGWCNFRWHLRNPSLKTLRISKRWHRFQEPTH